MSAEFPAVKSNADSVIQLRNISKNYGSYQALDDITLDVPKGVIGLLGPNGAGKSTLIKTLLGLVKITNGAGTVLGYDVQTQGAEIRSKIGYMPEDDCYVPGLSGVEMVRFAAGLAGLPHLEGLRRSHEILDFCGAEQERYRDIETYSTGMRQKVKFAQAIVHDPPLLILDEPTSSLDPEERDSMLSRIRLMSTKHNKSVIISTHILPDVQAICDYVIIIANGQVRLAKTMDDLRVPTAPGLNISTSVTAAPLIEWLQAKSFEVHQAYETEFVVHGVELSESEIVFQGASETRVGVLSLTPMINSLEEIFMNVVREAQHANP